VLKAITHGALLLLFPREIGLILRLDLCGFCRGLVDGLLMGALELGLTLPLFSADLAASASVLACRFDRSAATFAESASRLACSCAAFAWRSCSALSFLRSASSCFFRSFAFVCLPASSCFCARSTMCFSSAVSGRVMSATGATVAVAGSAVPVSGATTTRTG
jgi:hypothetical protein